MVIYLLIYSEVAGKHWFEVQSPPPPPLWLGLNHVTRES